ncbi:MAG: hypothetical protein IAF02_08740 [Anaerolineae bacterium]|nr:hypothetical protein [Anaerolineae bacterium]
MKVKQIVLLVVIAGILFTALSLSGNQATAQENLFTNPGFEEGHFNQDGIPEIAVPNGWRMHWLDGQTFPRSNGAAARPETVVWNIKDAPPSEQTLFFRDGIYALKIFKGWTPLYAALSQDVKGLEVGRKYRVAAPIYIDIVEEYGSRKKAPEDLDAGQVRIGAGPTGSAWLDENAINYSGLWTAGTTSPFYLSYPIFIHDFVATSENMTVWIEMGSKQPYVNNGFFLDGLSLTALDEVDPNVAQTNTSSGAAAPANAAAPVVSGPTSTPAPTATPRSDGAVIHIVQAGDTFWSLAIQYAPTMGITAEEALVAIPALNNNPAFFNPGDELIIVPPGAVATPEPTPEPETEEPTPEAEVVESEPLEESVTDSQTTNGVCVIVYEDKDEDAVYFLENESLLPNAAISLFQDGNSKASYVTDGINEPFCFENLEAGTYQVQVFPPAGYQSTTPESWAIAVSDGVIIPVTFGLVSAPQEVAEADAASVEPEATVMPTAETAVTPEASSGLGNFSGLLLIGAAFVVLLAGAGVFLLRRG